MIDAALWTTYGLVAVVCGAVLFRMTKRDPVLSSEYASTIEKGLMAAISLLAALFWPLVFPIALVVWLGNRETPAERRERLAKERDAGMRERDARIRQLERELGIGEPEKPTTTPSSWFPRATTWGGKS